MATFNGGPFLAEQLRSIATQTLLPDELIISDDRSSDDTFDIVASFSKTAPFEVKWLLNPEHLGFKRNFINATSVCRGDIICFCDQDDIWEDSKISTISMHFANSNDWAVTHDCSVFFNDGRQEIASFFNYLEMSGFSPVNNGKGCCLALRRAFVERFGWPAEDVDLSHDHWVCFLTTLIGLRGYIHAPLIRHRIHSQNATGYLLGGRDRIRSTLRRIRIPHLSRSDDIEAFVTRQLARGNIDLFFGALALCRETLTPLEYAKALTMLDAKARILEFPTTPSYAQSVFRALVATRWLLRGDYRCGDGFLGYVQDLYGDRNGAI